jgi:hypothetical protein
LEQQFAVLAESRQYPFAIELAIAEANGLAQARDPGFPAFPDSGKAMVLPGGKVLNKLFQELWKELFTIIVLP